MRLLFSADWHIKLGQKNVPKVWQKNRFLRMVSELNDGFALNLCDRHIVGGDILDRFDPTAEELELYFECIARINHPTDIYTGNHELVGKTHSVLFNLAEETARCNPLVRIITEPYRSEEYDIIDFTELHKTKWKPAKSKLAFTHVRGCIPPHVEPEIDLSRFDNYDLVVTGDLHSHQNTQSTEAGTPLVYPGSPLTTSFHRARTQNTNGYLVVDTQTLDWKWFDLGILPQLIRKTIQVGEEMVADEYDRVIYEVEGDIAELKGVKDSDLLDKKVNKNVGKGATLDLSKNEGITRELVLYLTEIQKLPETRVKVLAGRFKSIVPDAD